MANLHGKPIEREAALRLAMVEAACHLARQGLNRGTSGNIGVRLEQSFLVTPTGVPVEEMASGAMVEIDFSGAILSSGKPSSEWRFHRDIFVARPEVGAIVHTHSTFATVLACLQRDVPAFHYMIAQCGGDSIRCTPYALFGTQELSDLALQALRERHACLLGNHGLIALGRDLDAARRMAQEAEALCEQYWRTLQCGTPNILSNLQMQAVLEKFKNYGQK
jgi:L-fuculose-phosphate aldolase